MAVEAVVADLWQRAKKVKSERGNRQVGTISANGDLEVGTMISEAMQKVGKEGVITVEEAKSLTSNWKSSKACSSIAATSRRIS